MKEIRMYQQHPPFEVKEDSHFYKIGMFANMNRVTIKTLRYYDEQKLLMPEMGTEMERLGCICAEPAYCFIRYLEPGYSDEDILVEACEAVTEKKRVPTRWHSRCFRKFPGLPVYITEALTTLFIDPTLRY